METGRALEILKALCSGIDPYSGEVFPEGSVYQKADTVRALTVAVNVLDGQKEGEERQKGLPANAGKPWGEEEESKLLGEFDRGIQVKDIAREHGRTANSIHARLVKLGRITE